MRETWLARTNWLPWIIGGIAGFLSGGTVVADHASARPLERYSFEQQLMGTYVIVTVYAPDEASANTAQEAVFDRMQALVDILSDYDADSELRRLCVASGPGQPVAVSDDLWSVLRRSIEVSQQTDGAFDVTVGPYVELWRDARRRRRLPLPEQLAAAGERVGWRLMQLHTECQSVELQHHDMQIDLGGIAKGYIADESLRLLKELGFEQAMVAIAGDIRCGAAPPESEGWRIGIAPLDDPEATPERYLLLEHAAVSTSGDAYRFVEIDGVTYSHIVDPATGLGLTQSSSVTVVATDGLTADPLASAISVLGPERGVEFAEELVGVEAYIVTVDPETGRRHSAETVGFSQHLDHDR
jgi:thiamine biosynthesis lipoprotein